MRFLIGVAVAAAALTSGCGASDTYGVEETQAAFEAQGLVLREAVPPSSPSGGAITPWGSGRKVLVPRGDLNLFVFVGSATDAEQLWSMYRAHELEEGSDTFDARRANVLAISEGGLTASNRARVQAALESLRDKGSPVVVIAAPD